MKILQHRDDSEVMLERRARIEDLSTHIDLLKCKMKEILEEAAGDKLTEPLFMYTCKPVWHCDDSPIGWCVYNHFDDPAHDNCVFCGEPEERK